MMRKLKPALILGFIFALATFNGETKTGGDGFFNNSNKSSIGANTSSIIIMFLVGAVIGALPWKNIFNKLRRKS